MERKLSSLLIQMLGIKVQRIPEGVCAVDGPRRHCDNYSKKVEEVTSSGAAMQQAAHCCIVRRIPERKPFVVNPRGILHSSKHNVKNNSLTAIVLFYLRYGRGSSRASTS